MKIPSFIKKPVYSALIFFGTLGILSAGYAGFITLQSSDADSGKSLTSTMMQAVINNLNDMDSRIQTIVLSQSNGSWTPFNTDPTNGSIIQTLTIPKTGKYLVRSQTNFWITNTTWRNYLAMRLFLNGTTLLTAGETEAVMNSSNYPYDGSFILPSVVRTFNAGDVLTLNLRNPEPTSNNLVHYYNSAEILAELK